MATSFTIPGLLRDREFRTLPVSEQLKLLAETDASFGTLPRVEQLKLVADPEFNPVSAVPEGMEMPDPRAAQDVPLPPGAIPFGEGLARFVTGQLKPPAELFPPAMGGPPPVVRPGVPIPPELAGPPLRFTGVPFAADMIARPKPAVAPVGGPPAVGPPPLQPTGVPFAADVMARSPETTRFLTEGLAVLIPDVLSEIEALPEAEREAFIKDSGLAKLMAQAGARTVLELLTAPTSLATMGVLGMAGKGIKLAANAPRMVRLLSNMPKMRQFVNVASEIAVPAGVAGYAAPGVATQAAGATEAAVEGRPGEAAVRAAAMATGAAVAGVAGRQAFKRGQAVVGRQPPAGTPAEPISREEVKAGRQKVGGFIQRGERLTAEAWEDYLRVAGARPASAGAAPIAEGVKLHNRTVRIEPAGEAATGRPGYRIVDEATGEVITAGPAQSIKTFLRQREAGGGPPPVEPELLTPREAQQVVSESTRRARAKAEGRPVPPVTPTRTAQEISEAEGGPRPYPEIVAEMEKPARVPIAAAAAPALSPPAGPPPLTMPPIQERPKAPQEVAVGPPPAPKPAADVPAIRRQAIEARAELERIRRDFAVASAEDEPDSQSYPELFREVEGELQGPGRYEEDWAVRAAERRLEQAERRVAVAEPAGFLARQPVTDEEKRLRSAALDRKGTTVAGLAADVKDALGDIEALPATVSERTRKGYEDDAQELRRRYETAMETIADEFGQAEADAIRARHVLPSAEERGGPLAVAEPRPTAEYQEPAGPPSVRGESFRQIMNDVQAAVRAGETVTWADFTKVADRAFGGSMAKGTYDPREAYDAMEAGLAEAISRGDVVAPLNEPDRALRNLDSILERLPTQTLRTEEQQRLQQFSTPPTIGYVMGYALSPHPGDRVLEPSAGTGMLAAFARRAGAEVQVNEIAPRRAELLRAQGYEPTGINAEQINNIRPGPRPTAIIMNPPFSAAGVRNISENDTKVGVRHLEQALLYLQDGGRLVALMGEGMAFGQAKFDDWWRDTLSKYNVRANLHISGDLYRKFGTTFGTQLIVIDKTGATPGETHGARLANIERGAYTDLKEVANALRSIREDRKAVKPEGVERPAAPKPSLRAGGPAGLGPGVQPPTGGVRPQPGAVRRAQGVGEPRPGIRPAGIPGEKPGPRLGVATETGEPAEGAGEGVRPGRRAEPAGRLAPREALEDIEQAGVKFSTYRKHPDLQNFPEHPADIVESAAMAAVDAPAITYEDSIPKEIHKKSEKPLSALQVEAIRLAGQRHERLLPGRKNERAGFFIGDGTGVGKGQTIAGIILDNWYKGRKKAIWVTKSWDLYEAAKEDFKGIVEKDHPILLAIRRLDDWAPGDELDFGLGVLFTTYDTFKSGGKPQEEAEGQPSEPAKLRVEQLAQWAGDTPVIIFDEAHLAKNALVAGNGQPTIVGNRVMHFQDQIPSAYVVYSSATGATDVQNMGYMTRMGLWGTGTAFPEFNVFLGEIEGAGLGTKEMLSRDMKALGMYVSRSLSFRGVDYREVIHELAPEQKQMYDAAARIWQVVWRNLQTALGTTNSPAHVRRNARAQIWGANQRFFRQVTTALKVPTLLKDVERQLEATRSVVVGLIGTGESRTAAVVSQARAEGADLSELDFSPKQTLENYLKKIFPVQEWEASADPDDPDRIVYEPVIGPDGKPVQNAEMIELRDRMIEDLSKIQIPDNPLDQIIEHFGSDAVAELTGRRNRLITDPKSGKKEYVRRKIQGVAMDKTNLNEMQAFQEGKKRIAIISDASSVGISLHASNRAKNKQRRVHYALELGWSADKQLQSFGRTHRSDQATPPEYVLMSTNVGGEKRFSSTIARRLASLGALTRGQRDATGGGQLAKYNFESIYGSAAADALYGTIQMGALRDAERGVTPVDFAQMVADMGLSEPQILPRVQVSDQVRRDVPTFLNRLLSLEVDRQNALFDQFIYRFEHAVEDAKASGTFDEGVEDLKAVEVRLKNRTVVAEDSLTKALTYHVELEADLPTNPIPWDDALVQVGAKAGAASYRERFYKDAKTGGYVLAHETRGNITDAQTGQVQQNWAVHGPARSAYHYIRDDKFQTRYEKAGTDLVPRGVEEWWRAQLEKVPPSTTEPVHILAGAILPLWEKLKGVRGANMKVIRVTTKSGERVVGISIPSHQVREVLSSIGIPQELSSPEDIFDAVLENGEKVDLINGLYLTRVRWRNDLAIELKGHGSMQWKTLRDLGLQEVIDGFQRRFFVPTERPEGPRIIESITARWTPLPPTSHGDNDALKSNPARDFLRSVIKDETGNFDLGKVISNLREWSEIGRLAYAAGKGKRIGPTGIWHWANTTWHTPRYVGELHAPFMKYVDRAAAAYEEGDQLAGQLLKILEPYFKLSDEDRKKLDGRLIDARFGHRNEIDEAGLNERQLEAFRTVRQAMQTALDWLADLVVNIASNGRLASAEELGSQEAVEDALTDVMEKEDQGTVPDLAKKVWGILEEIRDAAAKGYVPFTRFGDYTYGLYPTEKALKKEPDLLPIHETRENSGEAAKRYVKIIKIPQYKKLIDSGKYVAREPEFRMRKVKQELLRDLMGFEIHIFAKIAQAKPEFAKAYGFEPEQLGKLAEGVQKMQQQFGFKAHFIEAKLVPGFERDLARPFADYILGLTRHIAKAKMFRDFSRWEPSLGHNPMLQRYAQNYVKYLQSPAEEWGWIRGMMFHWALGIANPMAAGVNLSQVMMMAAPWMLQYAGPDKVGAEVLKAYRDVAKAMNMKELRLDYSKLPEDVREDARQALEEGLLRAQATEQLYSLAARPGASRGLRERGKKVSTFLFSGSEHINRLVSFIAMHRLWTAKKPDVKDIARTKKIFAKRTRKFGLPINYFGSAREFAEYGVRITQLEYGRYNRPQLFRGRVGSLLGVFKMFAIGDLELAMRLFRATYGGGDGGKGTAGGGLPRIHALRAFLSYLMIGILHHGVFGLPFVLMFAVIADKAWKLYSSGEEIDTELELHDWFKNMTTEEIGDFLAHGSSWLGAFDASMSLGRGDPFGFGRALETGSWEEAFAVTATGGRVGAGIAGVLAGEGGRAGEALVPRTVAGGLRAARLAREGLRTRAGGQIVPRKQFTATELLGAAASVPLKRVSKAYEEERRVALLRTGHRDIKSRLVHRAAKAIDTKDKEGRERALAEIRAYNKVNRDKITAESINEAVKLRQLSPKQRRIQSLPRGERREYIKQQAGPPPVPKLAEPAMGGPPPL